MRERTVGRGRHSAGTGHCHRAGLSAGRRAAHQGQRSYDKSAHKHLARSFIAATVFEPALVRAVPHTARVRTRGQTHAAGTTGDIHARCGASKTSDAHKTHGGSSLAATTYMADNVTVDGVSSCLIGSSPLPATQGRPPGRHRRGYADYIHILSHARPRVNDGDQRARCPRTHEPSSYSDIFECHLIHRLSGGILEVELPLILSFMIAHAMA